ncbi:hypothetical protein KI387_012956, partial [Taxus chinensis]
DFNLQNLTIEDEEDNDASNVLDSDIGNLGKEKDKVIEEMNVKNLSANVTLPILPVNEPYIADKGVTPLSSLVSLCDPDLNLVSLEISLPINPDENVNPNWGEGWKMVNYKKRGKYGIVPLNMFLRSYKGKYFGS